MRLKCIGGPWHGETREVNKPTTIVILADTAAVIAGEEATTPIVTEYYHPVPVHVAAPGGDERWHWGLIHSTRTDTTRHDVTIHIVEERKIMAEQYARDARLRAEQWKWLRFRLWDKLPAATGLTVQQLTPCIVEWNETVLPAPTNIFPGADVLCVWCVVLIPAARD